MPLNLRDLLCKHIIAFSQTSDAVVWFAHHTDSTADSIDFWGACHCSGVWIDFSNTQLDWSMVLSVNDTVAGWAVKSKKNKIVKNSILRNIDMLCNGLYQLCCLWKHDTLNYWGYVYRKFHIFIFIYWNRSYFTVNHKNLVQWCRFQWPKQKISTLHCTFP